MDDGSVASDEGWRKIHHHRASGLHDVAAVPGGLAEDRAVQRPFRRHLQHLFHAVRVHDEQHALLGFRKGDLPGGHALFTQGDAVQVQRHAHAALGGDLTGGGDDSRGAHVLHGIDEAFLQKFQAAFDEELLREGVADLHLGPAGAGVLRQFHRREGRSGDAVPPSLCPQKHHESARLCRVGAHHVLQADDSGAEGVHEGVFRVGLVVDRLATHGGNAHGVAVSADARHDALPERFGFPQLRIPEEEAVHGCHGTRAHSENVPDDASHARCGALVRLHRGGVIVALHLEGEPEALSEVHDARVLPRPLDDRPPLDGEEAQQGAGGFVAAVFGPHDAEEAQLRLVGSAPQFPKNRLVFVLRQADGTEIHVNDPLRSSPRRTATRGGRPVLPEPGRLRVPDGA